MLSVNKKKKHRFQKIGLLLLIFFKPMYARKLSFCYILLYFGKISLPLQKNNWLNYMK